MWYLRLYDPKRKPNNAGYKEEILDSMNLFTRIRHHNKIDVVNMATGIVMRHDYKKPLPRWLGEPVARSIVISTGQIPNPTP